MWTNYGVLLHSSVDNEHYYTVKWWTPDKEVRPSLYTVVPMVIPASIVFSFYYLSGLTVYTRMS